MYAFNSVLSRSFVKPRGGWRRATASREAPPAAPPHTALPLVAQKSPPFLVRSLSVGVHSLVSPGLAVCALCDILMFFFVLSKIAQYTAAKRPSYVAFVVLMDV